MLFAPDTEESLEFVAALTNTSAGASKSGTDELATVEQLSELLGRYIYSGRIDHDTIELDDVLATRQRLRDVWTLPMDDMVPAVNAILLEARAVPQIVRHDGIHWHFHGTAADAPLAQRMLVEAALALADVIRTNETWRLRECEANNCDGLLVDLSKNGSKRFCTVRCGNRMNMIAYRARQAAEAEAGGAGT